MDARQKAMFDYCIAFGDDSLTLGHRLSEWCSNGPFLEEDLALTNVALDFIGRARMFYAHAAEVEGEGRDEDDYAYLRDCREYRNFLLHELPNGDFAFTMARQLMVDVFDVGFFGQLAGSKDPDLAAIGAKALKESRYHLRRSEDWIRRLGDGTDESHRRVQAGLEHLWRYTGELFECDDIEARLVDTGVAADPEHVRSEWRRIVVEALEEATLALPEDGLMQTGGRHGRHTEPFSYLIGEMQVLARAHPGATW